MTMDGVMGGKYFADEFIWAASPCRVHCWEFLDTICFGRCIYDE